MKIASTMLAATAMTLASSPLAAASLTMPEVLASTTAADWRAIPKERTLYFELSRGTAVMELAPQFAPRHVDNLAKLIRGGYFENAAILRSQDNYVIQWSNRSFGDDLPGGAAAKLAPEFYRSAKGLDFTRLDSEDAYAGEVGFVDGFPVGRDGPDGRAWLAHCYGAFGVGRDVAADSGNSAELYVVIGHAPRHLDRNVTLIGRVIDGMEHLSSLERGTGELGFYEDEGDYVPIEALRFAAADDPAWQALRTDTKAFQDLISSRRHRGEDWFVDPADAIGLCNVPLPVRKVE